MPKYRRHLPQLSGGKLFLTDSGLETTMLFLDGFELPSFEAFKYLETEAGRAWFRNYYTQHAQIAKRSGMGFVFESPTWRSNIDWGQRLGYTQEALNALNKAAIGLLVELRTKLETGNTPMVVSGCLGPLGDGYSPGEPRAEKDAQAIHAVQVNAFAETEADMVAAVTMTNIPEAIGVTRAAVAAGMPIAVSFTVETDGTLPTGEAIQAAIAAVDGATNNAPAYYMINCAHPTHFAARLTSVEDWTQRIKGLRANASRLSHAELDSATTLDDGNPVEFGAEHAELVRRLPSLAVLGGCCGTDHRHVEAIAEACSRAA